MGIVIDKEFESIIPPLTEDEYRGLESSILAEGCRDALSGLQYGNITPTDIDGLIEYKNKAYAIIEMKFGNAEIPKGQQLAIERMVDDFSKNGKLATAFLCEHNVINPEEDILAANAIVRSCYYNGHWKKDGRKTLKTRLDAFIGFAESL